MKRMLFPLALVFILTISAARCGAIPGACCFPDETCRLLTADECSQQGGAFYGEGVPCTPNPCLTGLGACCPYDGACVVTTFLECAAIPRACVWMAGYDCEPLNPCPQCCPVLCCLPGGACRLVMCGEDCDLLGGSPLEDVYFCYPNPCLVAGAEGAGTVPTEARLLVGPNPFRSSAVIRYQPEGDGFVQIHVFDVVGRRVREILPGIVTPNGPAVGWDGRDDFGSPVPAGIYFIRVSEAGLTATRVVVRVD